MWISVLPAQEKEPYTLPTKDFLGAETFLAAAEIWADL